MNRIFQPPLTQQRHETVVRFLQEMYVAFQSDAVRLALLQRPDIFLLFFGCHLSNEQTKPGCLGYIVDEILPSHVGIIIKPLSGSL